MLSVWKCNGRLITTFEDLWRLKCYERIAYDKHLVNFDLEFSNFTVKENFKKISRKFHSQSEFKQISSKFHIYSEFQYNS